MAMSVNGLIAREDGSEEFLSDVHWKAFVELAKEHGNIIVGRGTYEAVKKWDYGFGFDDLNGVTKIILSREKFDAPTGYLHASSPEAALKLLEEQDFDTALVAGGAHTNSAFAKAGLLDEIILNIEPAILGKGIPLFAPEALELPLSFESMQERDGIVQLRYSVKR